MKKATDLSKTANSGEKGKAYKPKVEGYLGIVAACVADRLAAYYKGDSYCADWRNDLLGAGAKALIPLLALDDRGKPDIHRLSKPVKYVRKAIKDAIEDYWQEHHKAIHMPASTRREWVERGEELPQFNFECINDVYAPLTENWTEGERTWYAKRTGTEKLIEAEETIVFLEESICADELDKAIIRARMGDADLIIHACEEIKPIHVADVAEQLGITEWQVQKRLDAMEQRYYAHPDIDRRVPKENRQQQPPRQSSDVA
ncbi:AsnC family protein [Botrimarina mediterranea]|uniref:Uncharacterized protein n=1 Tax=Botrimarina mediterranea TaxID=2528022 RepID=A0A518K5K4_9BACT|nr:AsnC family protein [Botrimarina mediterranea]QDV73068.1 hypothetical protein Spa11_12570 [Botrimarina mediterranea]